MAIMETVKDLSKRSVFSIRLSDSSNVRTGCRLVYLIHQPRHSQVQMNATIAQGDTKSLSVTTDSIIEYHVQFDWIIIGCFLLVAFIT